MNNRKVFDRKVLALQRLQNFTLAMVFLQDGFEHYLTDDNAINHILYNIMHHINDALGKHHAISLSSCNL